MDPASIRAELMRGVTARCTAMDLNVDVLIGQCGCARDASTAGLHHHTDRLLHELFLRTMCTETADDADRQLCIRMKESGIFPDRYGGKLAVAMPDKGTGEEKYELEVAVVTDAAPAQNKAEMEQNIKGGLLYDATVRIYMLCRKQFALQLLTKLFDVYQYTIRRVIPKNPMERLRGCDFCHQSCDGDEAVRCITCEVQWWCCKGCKEASAHGRKCPFGIPSESRVLFSW